MATHPLSFSAKEHPFDVNYVRAVLTRLLTESPEAVESHTLEIKGWCKDEKELAEKVSEAAACLANASGGLVLIGISDETAGRSKFSPCPHSSVTLEWLINKVHSLTRPSVECSAHDL